MEASSSDLLERLQLIKKGERLLKAPPLKGVSEVVVLSEGRLVTLVERGSWLNCEGIGTIAFTSVFCFRPLESGTVVLEHLRYGKKRPIFLVELVPAGPHMYTSRFPHTCKEDIYAADVLFDGDSIHLNWQVTGPSKRSLLQIIYT